MKDRLLPLGLVKEKTRERRPTPPVPTQVNEDPTPSPKEIDRRT